MNILEDQTRKEMARKKLTPKNIYKPLGINRVNFYKAVKISNLENKSLKKILDFLGLFIKINLKKV